MEPSDTSRTAKPHRARKTSQKQTEAGREPRTASLVASSPSLSVRKLPFQQTLGVEANASQLTTAAASDIVDPVDPGCRDSESLSLFNVSHKGTRWKHGLSSIPPA